MRHQVGTDWVYGTDVDYLRQLVAYWREEYDWREQERQLNRFDQYKTRIDGLDIHFIHQRSPEDNALPLLILHGENDPRVHPSQSMEMYRHLKELGKTPVRLVFYPGEGHGNRKSAARLDYNLRMLRWFDHYLKGPGGSAPPYELDYGVDAEKPAEPDTPR